MTQLLKHADYFVVGQPSIEDVDESDYKKESSHKRFRSTMTKFNSSQST